MALLALTGLAESGRHTVKKGETLAAIARANGTTVAALAEANALADPNFIIAGSTLVIPGGGGAVASGAYVVEPGDTLASIARHHGLTTAALAEANSISNRNLIVIGTTLQIPGGATSAPAAGAAAAGVYVVEPGDTLASIARHHGLTTAALAEANSISNRNLIVIGTTLQIPGGATGASAASAAVAMPGGSHVVAAGESLASIARRYGVTTDALAAANGITAPAFRIYSGTRLSLASAPTPPAIACPVPGASFFNDWGFPRSGGRFHEGNDLFAPLGTPVVAPVSGSVHHVTGVVGGLQFRLTGNDGTQYIGSHMSDFGQGGTVEAGTVIGYVGDSGNAKGARPHLHFEVHPGGGGAVNPYPAVAVAC